MGQSDTSCKPANRGTSLNLGVVVVGACLLPGLLPTYPPPPLSTPPHGDVVLK